MNELINYPSQEIVAQSRLDEIVTLIQMIFLDKKLVGGKFGDFIV